MPTTYGQLKSQVADFLQRSDLTAFVPTFIADATARFSDELRTPEMEAVASTTLTGEWTALPTDFRAMRLLEAGGKVLEYKTPWQMQRLVETAAVPYVPVYTIQDMQFRVYPFPSSTAVELTYYAALPDFAADGDSNWLLNKRPDIYRMGAIAQARVFLHDDPRAMMALQIVDKFIAEQNRSARQIAVGAAPLAVTPG
jgi:hypothetical protein